MKMLKKLSYSHTKTALLSKKTLSFFVGTILFLWSISLSGQAPDTLWTKTYGGTDWDYGLSTQETFDGGYIVAGWTESFGTGLGDVYLIKTDSLGDTIWTKTYGDTADDEGYAVQQTSDSGYIIAGLTSSISGGDVDVYLIKTDSAGNPLWIKTYGDTADDKAYAVQQTSDGGYIIAGSTRSFGAGWDDVYLIKTDAGGNTLWTKTYGGTNNDVARSVQETADSGFIIAGRTMSFGSGGMDIYLIKTDVNGNPIWIKTYGGIDNDWGESVQMTSDGGYIAAGWTYSFGVGYRDVYLVKTDSIGDTIWTRTYGGTGEDESYCIKETSDGGYIISGYTTSFGSGGADVYLIKTDTDGDTIWTTTYGGTGHDRGFSVDNTSDNGYVITGYTTSFGAGLSDVYFLKLAPDVGIEEEKDLRNKTTDIKLVCHPNSFTTAIHIAVSLPGIEHSAEGIEQDIKDIELRIFDVAGRLVKDFSLGTVHSALTTAVTWGGKDNSGRIVSGGIYFLKYNGDDYQNTKKLLLIR